MLDSWSVQRRFHAARTQGTALQRRKEKKQSHSFKKTVIRPEPLELFSLIPPHPPAPWRPSLDLMPVLYTILGKYRPAELICFPHQ